MTEAGTRVTSVRRTVRVAVALVTGQALLCGFIGFLTFGRGDEPAPARTSEPRLAGPPLVVPPAEVPAPSASAGLSGSTTARPTRTRRPPTRSAPVAVRSSAIRTPAPAASPTVRSKPPPKSAPTTSAPAGVFLSASPQAPVDDPPTPVAGQECEEAGATGRTAGGKAVRCERDRDGDLHWVPV